MLEDTASVTNNLFGFAKVTNKTTEATDSSQFFRNEKFCFMQLAKFRLSPIHSITRSFTNKSKSKHGIMLYPHLVFGYGSLICPDSRAITAPTVSDRTALPVSINGVERTWAKKSQTSKATSMGVQFRDGAECVGVLVPVNDDELKAFDKREVGYDRYEIRLEDIEAVAHLLGDEENDIYEDTFLQEGFDVTVEEDVPQVWIYVQQNQVPASIQYPIAQSYVDVMLRGCLTISKEFAEEFIETTKGWHPAELSDSDDESDESISSDSDDMEEGWWVDDRRDPLYVRADSEYSLRHQHKLDSLLKEKIPSNFSTRIRRGKSQVHRQ
jgi:cation transport regulator ChaC